jgi:hypothetical protein
MSRHAKTTEDGPRAGQDGPFQMPSPTVPAAEVAAVQQRAERAAAREANRRRSARPDRAVPPGVQLLRTTEGLLLQHTDTGSDPGLLHILVVALLLGVFAALLGGVFAFVIGSCLAVALLTGLSDREVACQRTVRMDVAQAVLTVQITWSRRQKTHHRQIPASALRLRMDRWETQIEGVASTCWTVSLVLPYDAHDPGDDPIELAVFGGPDAEAARALCRRLIAHLGLPDLPLRWHRLGPSEQQSGSGDETA